MTAYNSNRGARDRSISLQSITARFNAIVLAWLIVGACSRSGADAHRLGATEQNAVDTLSAPGPLAAKVGVATAGPIVPVSSASSTPRGHSACPRTGLWALCSVEDRLTHSGFVVRRADGSPKRAGFSVLPQLYTLGRSRLEVFLYPNAAAATADFRGIDTLSAAPRGAPNPWGMTPTFVRSANLLAVFLTDNPTYAERLTLALTAGAPQP